MTVVFDELIGALEQLQVEKGFSKEALLEVVEQALGEAYRQRFEPDGEVEVRIDVDSGELKAGIHRPDGYEPIPPERFRDAAATTARKVVFSRLRDAEREQVLRDALRHQGELASAVVDRVDGDVVYVKTDHAEAILPPEEQIPAETYHPEQRLKVLLLGAPPQSQNENFASFVGATALVDRLDGLLSILTEFAEQAVPAV